MQTFTGFAFRKSFILFGVLLAACLPVSATVVINSVAVEGPSSNPTIIILGSGFGTEPTGSTPTYNFGGLDFPAGVLSFQDGAATHQAWSAGSAPNGNTIGLIVSNYSDTEIVYQFGSALTNPSIYGSLYTMGEGDPFTVEVNGTTFNGTVNFVYPQLNYTSLDPPGSTTTYANAVSGNNVVGDYIDSGGTPHAYLYNSGIYTELDPPGSAFPAGSSGAVALGVSGNNVVGRYTDSGGTIHGFLYNGTNFTMLDPSGSVNTNPIAISGNNVVGNYTDSGGTIHGFLYNGTGFTTLDPTGSTGTYPNAISGNTVVGSYTDSGGVWHGFTYSGSSFATLDPTGSTYTSLSGCSGNNVVGDCTDTTGYHGFIYYGATYAALNATGDSSTIANGVDGNNVVGFYEASGENLAYIYNGTSYTTLDPFGSTNCTADAVSGNNVVGYWIDGDDVLHGYLAENKVAATVTLNGDLNPTYNGAAQALTATTDPAGLNVVITYQEVDEFSDPIGNPTTVAPTDAGTYEVEATINDPVYTGSQGATLTISPEPVTVTVNNLTVTYDGSQQAVSATALSETTNLPVDPSLLDLTLEYTGDPASTGPYDSDQPPTDVALYSVTPTIGNPDYELANPGTQENVLNIESAPQTIALFLGNVTVLDVIVLPEYTDAGNLVTYSLSASSYVTSTAYAELDTGPDGFTDNILTILKAGPPGSITVYATAPGDVNHLPADPPGQSPTVNLATATVTLQNLAPTYSGTAQAATATTNPTTLYTDGDVTFSYTDSHGNTSSAPPTAAGRYNVIAMVYDPNDVYTGTQTGTLIIAPAPLAITANNANKTYGQTLVLGGTAFSSTGLRNSETIGSVTLNSTGTVSTATVAGSPYSIIPTNATGGTFNPANYTINYVNGLLTISKATGTMILGNLSSTYNGLTKAATATTTPTGLNVTFTYNGSAAPPSAVASYTVVGTINDANYQGNNSGTLTISAVSMPQTYTQWGTSDGFSGAVTAIPYKDGVPNLLKYLFDIDPSGYMNVADRNALPTLGINTTAGKEYLTLTYRQYAGLTGVSINVQTSPDMKTWTTVSPPDLSQQIGMNGNDPVMEVGVLLNGSAKQFIRLNVTQP